MSCLGDPSRFHLVRQLARGERCVSDLARRIGRSQSCTTRHLQALQREQIVRGERAGKRVLFHLRLDEPQIGALLAWVMAARPERPGGPGIGSPRPTHGADLHTDRTAPYGGPPATRPPARPGAPRARRRSAPTSRIHRPPASLGPPAADPGALDVRRPSPETSAPASGVGQQPGGAVAPAPDVPAARYRAPRSDLEDYLL
jgi:DNA-binding transcriptional ArsR family regulator